MDHFLEGIALLRQLSKCNTTVNDLMEICLQRNKQAIGHFNYLNIATNLLIIYIYIPS